MSTGGDINAAIAGFDREIVLDRLRLRPARADDGDVLLPHFADWDVLRWLSRPDFPVRRQSFVAHYAEAEVRRRNGQEALFVIDGPEGPIGAITWRFAGASSVQATAGSNIGYWLGRRFWGKGYMSAAATGLVDTIFAETTADVIYSGLFDGNAASLGVQEKLGFTVVSRAMVWCNPRQANLPHLNTTLTRGARDRTTT